MKPSPENKKLAQTFNNFFCNINFDIYNDLSHLTSITDKADPAFRANEKYANHLSILKIKRKMSDKRSGFSFKYVTKKKLTMKCKN